MDCGGGSCSASAVAKTCWQQLEHGHVYYGQKLLTKFILTIMMEMFVTLNSPETSQTSTRSKTTKRNLSGPENYLGKRQYELRIN